MKTAFVFPGQGSQFVGMGKIILEKYPSILHLLKNANDILGFDILHLINEGTSEDLKQTKVTQNAVFIYSIAALNVIKFDGKIDGAAGHSLGEFSSLVAAKVLSFEEALHLVDTRASAMQKACEAVPSTMAAVLGLDDHILEEVCSKIKNEIVTPANYNCQGQIVISGTMRGIALAKEELLKAGAKRVIGLDVGGAFHSALMQPAQKELAHSILKAKFHNPLFPIYQNVTAKGTTDTQELQKNLIAQLTGAVKWTQTIEQMIADGITQFIEVGPGKVLQGLIQKINPHVKVLSWENL